ncbi:unnamed protein product, partial [Nesidiocoris tenuis]
STLAIGYHCVKLRKNIYFNGSSDTEMYPYSADQTSVSPPWNKGTGALNHERTETAISRCSENDKDRLPYVLPVITQKPHFLRAMEARRAAGTRAGRCRAGQSESSDKPPGTAQQAVGATIPRIYDPRACSSV